MSKTEKVPRNVSKPEAAVAVLFMLAALGIGNGVLGFNLRVMLILSLAVDIVIALRCGYTWNDCQKAFSEKIGPLAGLFLILLGIGFVIGTWVTAGTVPVLVAWLARLINPRYILVLTFVLVSVLASVIGSNFASAGTLGLVMFSVAVVQGLPVGLAAAAAVCGANFGSYISPVADQPNNAAAINGFSTYDAIRQMAPPVGVASVLTAAFFFFMGLRFTSGSGAGATAEIESLIATVETSFVPSLLVLLPLIVCLALSFLKLPSAVVLYSSGAVALLIGVFVQGFSVQQCITAAYSGFSSATMLEGEVPAILATLVNRGGMFSMADGIIFMMLAVMCTAVMGKIGVFRLISGAFGNFKSVGNLNLAANVYVMFAALLTTDMVPTHVIAAESLHQPFEKLGYSPKKVMAIAISSGRMVTCMLPWSFPAIYMAGVFGCAVVDYLPFAVFFPLVVVCQIVLTYLGVGNEKLPGARDLPAGTPVGA